MGSTVDLRVAILQNYLNTESGAQLMLDNITSLVHASRPHARVDVFAPIHGEAFPDPDAYDLVILTGGPFNLMTLEGERPEWVTGTLDFIRTVAAGGAASKSGMKMLGICWGQQAMALALGGSLCESKGGFRMGVETLQLNSAGAKFFGAQTLDIQKQHMLAVADPGPHLLPLALRNEILLSPDACLLSFQGHPEMDPTLSQTLIGIDDPSHCTRPKGGSEGEGKEEGLLGFRGIDAPHDGPAIFARIVAWAIGETV